MDTSELLLTAVKDGNGERCSELLNSGALPESCDTRNRTALMIAAEYSHQEICQILLSAGASGPRALVSSIITEVEVAARAWKVLVAAGVDVNAAYQDGWTALIVAAQKSRASICRELIAAGANPNSANRSGWTALMMGVQAGHLETCIVLLRNGADVNLKGQGGATAVYIAAQNGQADICSALASSGADLNSDPLNGWTPLMVAAQNGHKNACASLLTGRSNPDMVNKKGWTALMVAAQNGHGDVCALLAQACSPAALNLVNKSGWTALMMAANAGSILAVKALLSAGADLSIRNNEGLTALMIAENNDLFDVCAELAPIAARHEFMSKKRGPLAMRRLMLPMWAQRIFAVEGEVLRFSRSWSDKLPAGSINLRGCRIELHTNSTEGFHPFTIFNAANSAVAYLAAATATRAAEWVEALAEAAGVGTAVVRSSEYLIAGGEEVPALKDQLGSLDAIAEGDAVSDEDEEGGTRGHKRGDGSCYSSGGVEEGWTPLHVAANEGRTESCLLLLRSGVDANVTIQDGCTPLMLAAFKGRTETCAALLAAGADVSVENQSGMTALMLAEGQQHYETCAVLAPAVRRASQTTSKRGTLLMKRGSLPLWATRLCILSGRKLEYRHSFSDKMNAGVIELAGCVIEHKAGTEKDQRKHRFRFDILDHSGNIICQLASPAAEDANEWVKLLNDAATITA